MGHASHHAEVRHPVEGRELQAEALLKLVESLVRIWHGQGDPRRGVAVPGAGSWFNRIGTIEPSSESTVAPSARTDCQKFEAENRGANTTNAPARSAGIIVQKMALP
jgi:hypothetical protein